MNKDKIKFEIVGDNILILNDYRLAGPKCIGQRVTKEFEVRIQDLMNALEIKQPTNNVEVEQILSRLLVNALLGCEVQTDDEVKEQEMRNEVIKDINSLRSALSNVETKSAKEIQYKTFYDTVKQLIEQGCNLDDIKVVFYHIKDNLKGGINGKIQDKTSHSPQIEFETKLKFLKDKLYTRKAKEIARERTEYFENFLNRLEEEIKGEI